MKAENRPQPQADFKFERKLQPIEFVESVKVNDNVVCEVYSFPNDPDKDLGIIEIKAGCATPLQEVIEGEKTIEGHISGNGMLTVFREGKHKKVFIVRDNYITKLSVEVNIGDIMQWHAAPDSDLRVYEICFPPYKDGRYQNLSE